MTLKIKDYSITGQNAKRTGVFVGAFQTSGKYAFASLGFRGYDSSVGTDALSGYWMKGTGKAGNGSAFGRAPSGHACAGSGARPCID